MLLLPLLLQLLLVQLLLVQLLLLLLRVLLLPSSKFGNGVTKGRRGHSPSRRSAT